MLRNKPHFARGRPRSIDDQMRLDQSLGFEFGGERTPGIVVADDADEDATRAQRGDIAGYVARATHHQFALRDAENGRRRFGRNAHDLAIDEIIEHQVADADDGLVANKLERPLEVEHDTNG